MALNDIANDLNNLKRNNWRLIWEPFMRKYDCQFICEIGVDDGFNFIEMTKHNPMLAVAIDNWSNSDEKYLSFKNIVNNLPFSQVIKDDSVHAAKNFQDNYFDFVYIDADHSYEACSNDIQTWYPKVKPGKFLLGHDYRQGFGVTHAVRNFVKANQLEFIFRPPSTWGVIKK